MLLLLSDSWTVSLLPSAQGAQDTVSRLSLSLARTSAVESPSVAIFSSRWQWAAASLDVFSMRWLFRSRTCFSELGRIRRGLLCGGGGVCDDTSDATPPPPPSRDTVPPARVRALNDVCARAIPVTIACRPRLPVAVVFGRR